MIAPGSASGNSAMASVVRQTIPLHGNAGADTMRELVILQSQDFQLGLIRLDLATQPPHVRLIGEQRIAFHEAAAQVDVARGRELRRDRLVQTARGVNETQRRPVRGAQRDAGDSLAQFRRELAHGPDFIALVGLKARFVHAHWRREVQQNLASEPMAVKVGQAEGNDRDIGATVRGGVQRHSGGAGLERRQSGIGVADAFGEDCHAATAGQDVVHALEGVPVVRIGSVLLAA